MNCIDLFVTYAKKDPQRPAFWLPKGQIVTFGQLLSASAKAQKLCQEQGIVSGDGVLLFDVPSPRMYAALIGILGMGCHVILVEPWMPLSLINRAISLVKPKLFLTRPLGRVWGARSEAIRGIPKWCSLISITLELDQRSMLVRDVLPTTPGVITFTTGTTGHPKGVVRTHEFLLAQHHAISDLLRSQDYSGPDLCIFANFALTNLAAGRCSLLVPNNWSAQFFKILQNLPKKLMPETLTCGPAFLKRLIEMAPHVPFNSIHIGGALTDCDLFEKGFDLWPEARWLHVYGSSEAEPVSGIDARVAVAESRKAGSFQTLFIGTPIPQIKARLQNETLWVAGPHVSTFYLGDEESNQRNKSLDKDGTIWHDMGDRIIVTEKGWWYGGRSSQPRDEFALEQRIYAYLQSSAAFVKQDAKGKRYLFGENIHRKRQQILSQFRELTDVFDLIVYRDHRHRARIDRHLSLKKGAPWIVG